MKEFKRFFNMCLAYLSVMSVTKLSVDAEEAFIRLALSQRAEYTPGGCTKFPHQQQVQLTEDVVDELMAHSR